MGTNMCFSWMPFLPRYERGGDSVLPMCHHHDKESDLLMLLSSDGKGDAREARVIDPLCVVVDPKAAVMSPTIMHRIGAWFRRAPRRRFPPLGRQARTTTTG